MKIIPIILLLLLAGGCARPLQPDNYAERITASRLDADTFLVSFRGRAASTPDRTVDLTLLKSAETALENGFNYFIIVKTSESGHTASGSNGGQVESYLQNSGYEPTVVGAVTYSHADPGSMNTIVCFREKPQGFSYIALILKASLRAKYKLNRVSG
jgi:hypothetical protein